MLEVLRNIMARHWIKLWVEMLSDPKVARLPDWQWRKFIEFILLAGSNDADGKLQPVNEMAWILRISDTTLSESLQALELVGVVHQENDGSWFVTNFNKRQETPDAERMRKKRAKEKDEQLREQFGEQFAQPLSSASPLPLDSDSLSFNLLRLYETEIGIVTPLIHDALQEAGQLYPAEWFLPAFQEAANNNARNWSYASAILKRWKREGFQSAKKPGNGRHKDNNGKTTGAIERARKERGLDGK